MFRRARRAPGAPERDTIDGVRQRPPLDPVAHAMSMVSVPRDMVDVPLADGRIDNAKINRLVAYDNWHPSRFKD